MEVKYYLNDNAKHTGIAAYKETINGDRHFVEEWAKNKLRTTNFVAYDLIER